MDAYKNKRGEQLKPLNVGPHTWLLVSPDKATKERADKYKHFAVGAFVAAVVLLVGTLVLPKWAAVSTSMIVVGLAGAAKEIYDDRSDRSDIFATSLGGLVVWIVYLIG